MDVNIIESPSFKTFGCEWIASVDIEPKTSHLTHNKYRDSNSRLSYYLFLEDTSDRTDIVLTQQHIKSYKASTLFLHNHLHHFTHTHSNVNTFTLVHICLAKLFHNNTLAPSYENEDGMFSGKLPVLQVRTGT